jgi:16S rRNA (cytosine967-C5)-methyltransferase
MTPGARIAAAIEILAEIAAGAEPADAVTDSYYRQRRYAGAKDRRLVNKRVYDVLRRRARLDWWIARAGSPLEASPRTRVIADLALADKAGPQTIAELFSGGTHCPAPLTADERSLAEALAGRPLTHHSEMPDWVALEYPEWLDRPLRAAFGKRLKQEMTVLNQPAPVDLRVNTLKSTWEEARDSLAAEHVATEPTPLSPLGLRLKGAARLGGTRAYKTGLVDIQDEGAQLVSLLADARPGMVVVDFCAGAGGKTLALAAAMGEGGRLRGRLIACDVFARRLQRMEERLARAGAVGVERRVLATEEDAWVAENAGVADRVLLDVPCSGSGTWRREPDAKWRLGAIEFREFVATQRRILESARRLVKPGGRLAYATCSLLPEENERQIEWFLDAHPGFEPLPVDAIWRQTIGGPEPPPGPLLRLSPAASGTDGFFLVVLERTGA